MPGATSTYKFSGGKEAGIIIPVPVEPPTSLRLLAGSRPDRCLPLGHRSLRTSFLGQFCYWKCLISGRRRLPTGCGDMTASKDYTIFYKNNKILGVFYGF